MTALDLSNVSTDALLDELLKRPGMVSSIWSVEDVREIVAEDEECEILDDAQLEAVCTQFLSRAARGLSDVLGQRGNDYLSDHWASNRSEILRDALAPSLKP